MASSTVGEAVVKLTFDGKEVQASLERIEGSMDKAGKSGGSVFANAWSVAAGNLLAKGFSKITSMITSNLDNAIARVDTLANSQKVFTAMGYSVDATSKSMKTLTGYLDGLPTSMTSAVQNVQSLSASFGGIEKGTQVFIDMNNAGLAFGATSAMIDNAILQLGQLSLDGPLDAQTWRSLQNSGFAPVFAAMAKQAGMTVGELKEDFGGKGTKTVGDFLEMLHKLNTEGGGDMESLSELARKNTTGIGTALENVQNRIGKAIAKVIDYIGQENISGIINDISSHFSDLADGIIAGIGWIQQNWGFVSEILKGVSAFFAGLLAMNIATKVQGFFAAVTAFATTNPALLAIGAIVAGLTLLFTHLDQIKPVINAIGDALGAFADWLRWIFQGLGEFVAGVWNNMVAGAKGAWNGIKSVFGAVAGFFKSVFTNAWNAVKAVFSTGGKIFAGIVDGIVKAFKGIVNAIIRGINGVVSIPFNTINGILNGLRNIDILGVRPFGWLGTIGVPQIPYLAQGGYAGAGATGAVIGEAGKEVVLPLENNTDNWAGLLASTLAEQFEEEGYGGGGIAMYNTFEINNDMDANEIGRKLEQSMRRMA